MKKIQFKNPMDLFMGLYEHASDSIEAQDELIAFYKSMAMIGGGYSISDADARQTFENIMKDESLCAHKKDAYLSALDVMVQNHHPAGMAAGIMNEIHAAQGNLILYGTSSAASNGLDTTVSTQSTRPTLASAKKSEVCDVVR